MATSFSRGFHFSAASIELIWSAVYDDAVIPNNAHRKFAVAVAPYLAPMPDVSLIHQNCCAECSGKVFELRQGSRWIVRGNNLISASPAANAESSTTRAGPQPLRRRPQRRSTAAHYRSHAFRSAATLLFSLSVVGILGFAWSKRGQGYLYADHGTGYWLGIAGTAVMVLLFTYPLRKRFPSLAPLGSVAAWFRIHMIFGIAGPAMIVLHSNFNLGPLNSMLALISMLIVVSSGIIGRYLHAHVHNGLYGQHAQLSDILADIAALEQHLRQTTQGRAAAALASMLGADANNGTAAAHPAPMTRAATQKIRRNILADLKTAPWLSPRTGLTLTAAERRTALARVDAELRTLSAALAKASRLRFYERLLSIWHHLHMPLFTLLAITVVMHIIAVELY